MQAFKPIGQETADIDEDEARGNNMRFDAAVMRITQGQEVGEFVLTTPGGMQRLMADPVIANHVTRPSSRVFFKEAGLVPSLARHEGPLYTAIKQLHGVAIPFRETDPEAERYRSPFEAHFSSRSTTMGALQFQRNALEAKAKQMLVDGAELDIMMQGDLKRDVEEIAYREQMRGADGQAHIYLIHARSQQEETGHAVAALLWFDAGQTAEPSRVIFFDTEQAHGEHINNIGVMHHAMNAAFWQTPRSLVVDASHPLQMGGSSDRMPHEVNRNCSLYCEHMLEAALEVLAQDPGLLRHGSAQAIRDATAAHMPKEYAQPYQPGDRPIPEYKRMQSNARERWDKGRLFMRLYARELSRPQFGYGLG